MAKILDTIGAGTSNLFRQIGSGLFSKNRFSVKVPVMSKFPKESAHPIKPVSQHTRINTGIRRETGY